MREIILASASPRRKDLLEQVGISCRVVPSLIEESITTTVPQDVVQELSRQKCEDVAGRQAEDCVVLGADTIVSVHGKILGKPADEAQAVEMLQELQGNTHQVYTGVTLIWKSKKEVLREETFYEMTDVTFYGMSDEEIRNYVSSKEPMDKAGAYGIQGLSAKFIERICGDYNNVVGLPVASVYQKLKAEDETSRKKPEGGYRIRPVEEADLKVVAEIEAACFPAAEAASCPEFLERYQTCRNSFFVAESGDGDLIGFCNGCVTDSDELSDDLYHDSSKHDENGKYQMIFGLDTLPSYRGLGVGQALMRHMIKNAKERGEKAVILTCKEHMIPFYERIGYEFLHKADSNHGGAVWYKMIYHL